MSPLQQQLVGQLRAAYHESGLTYQQITERTSISTRTIHRALHGRSVTMGTFIKLCAVLKRKVTIQ